MPWKLYVEKRMQVKSCGLFPILMHFIYTVVARPINTVATYLVVLVGEELLSSDLLSFM